MPTRTARTVMSWPPPTTPAAPARAAFCTVTTSRVAGRAHLATPSSINQLGKRFDHSAAQNKCLGVESVDQRNPGSSEVTPVSVTSRADRESPLRYASLVDERHQHLGSTQVHAQRRRVTNHHPGPLCSRGKEWYASSGTGAALATAVVRLQIRSQSESSPAGGTSGLTVLSGRRGRTR